MHLIFVCLIFVPRTDYTNILYNESLSTVCKILPYNPHQGQHISERTLVLVDSCTQALATCWYWHHDRKQEIIKDIKSEIRKFHIHHRTSNCWLCFHWPGNDSNTYHDEPGRIKQSARLCNATEWREIGEEIKVRQWLLVCIYTN